MSLYPLLGFLQENSLTKQLLPSIDPVEGTVLYDPAERFHNLTFAEFIYTETLNTRLTKKLDEEPLDKLIDVLYRLQRQGYNPTSPNYKANKVLVSTMHKAKGKEFDLDACYAIRKDLRKDICVFLWLYSLK